MIVALVGPALGEEALVVERGTAGLAATPVRVVNETDRPVVCAVAIAHWYSAEIGTAAPRQSLAATLWSNPATGEVFLLNASEDRMPVQRLWCGYAAADVSTRSEVDLARRKGQPEPPVALVCGVGGDARSLDCRRGEAE